MDEKGTKIVNADGSITWRFTLQELIDYKQQIAENPTHLDIDLEMKDRRDSWRD